jgi:hypothetical protein
MGAADGFRVFWTVPSPYTVPVSDCLPNIHGPWWNNLLNKFAGLRLEARMRKRSLESYRAMRIASVALLESVSAGGGLVSAEFAQKARARSGGVQVVAPHVRRSGEDAIAERNFVNYIDDLGFFRS